MDTVLVISKEPALADILAAELPGCALRRAATPEEMATQLEGVSMVVLDKHSLEITPPEMVPVVNVSRPVRLSELLYTIRERLQAKTRQDSEDTIAIGNCRFSLREKLLAPEGKAAGTDLTEKEAELLIELHKNIDNTMHKDELLRLVWGYVEGTDTHTLETHIYRLRGKLRQIGASFDIVSGDGAGYRILPN